ncbi:MAG: molybdate ABC transporter permease subunit, partial [Jiangellaceae bacterium]
MTATRAGDTRVPLGLLVPSLLGLLILLLPMVGLTLRAPWGRLAEILTSAEVLTALRLSLTTATIATGVCLVCGVPLAWLLARSALPGR